MNIYKQPNSAKLYMNIGVSLTISQYFTHNIKGYSL